MKDASGAVLPGVTVEAASAALIEKVRTVVTDDRGEYRVIDPRPGAYTGTFRQARRGVCVATLAFAITTSTALAQTPAAPPDAADAAATRSPWSVRAAAATYLLPDDDNYVQPTIAVDRDALHLESRYNYEDRDSLSGFIGWNLAAGSKVTLELTPMVGVVVGETNGVIPAIELTVGFWRVEAYSEGEYVIDVDDRSNRFLYNWSEVSLRVTEWLRAGLVTQRTRTLRLPPALERDIQRGVLGGVSFWKIEGAVYWFNPGSDDSYIVASIGVSF